MRELTGIERKLLLGMAMRASELREYIENRKHAPHSCHRHSLAEYYQYRAFDELETIGVQIDLVAWLGTNDPAARMAASRALSRLERAGLVVRHSRWMGARPTHAKLTEAGQS